MWEITLSGQVSATLWSVPIGAAFCLLYDLIRAFRQKLHIGFVLSFVLDVLFFILCAFVTFCIFLIFCAGQIRFYVFIGLLAGFLLCRFTLSRLFLPIFAGLIGLVSRMFSLVCAALGRIFSLWQKIFGKIAIFARNIAKKLLQPVCRLLYNLKRNQSTDPTGGDPVSDIDGMNEN